MAEARLFVVQSRLLSSAGRPINHRRPTGTKAIWARQESRSGLVWAGFKGELGAASNHIRAGLIRRAPDEGKQGLIPSPSARFVWLRGASSRWVS